MEGFFALVTAMMSAVVYIGLAVMQVATRVAFWILGLLFGLGKNAIERKLENRKTTGTGAGGKVQTEPSASIFKKSFGISFIVSWFVCYFLAFIFFKLYAFFFRWLYNFIWY